MLEPLGIYRLTPLGPSDGCLALGYSKGRCLKKNAYVLHDVAAHLDLETPPVHHVLYTPCAWHEKLLCVGGSTLKFGLQDLEMYWPTAAGKSLIYQLAAGSHVESFWARWRYVFCWCFWVSRWACCSVHTERSTLLSKARLFNLWGGIAELASKPGHCHRCGAYHRCPAGDTIESSHDQLNHIQVDRSTRVFVDWDCCGSTFPGTFLLFSANVGFYFRLTSPFGPLVSLAVYCFRQHQQNLLRINEAKHGHLATMGVLLRLQAT